MSPVCLSCRHKAGGSNAESILISQLQHGLTLEFEHSDPLRRLRLALSELLAIMNKVRFPFLLPYKDLKICSLDSKYKAYRFLMLQAYFSNIFQLSNMKDIFSSVLQVTDSNGEFFLKSSELFESPVYLDEVADVLCILQAGK